MGNPVKLVDPDGKYPIVTVTTEKTREMTWQRIIGYTNVRDKEIYILVPLYRVKVSDTEDKTFHQEFSVTRDAYAVMYGNSDGKNAILSNVAFEPRDEKNNRYQTGKLNYPKGTSNKALALLQNNSLELEAEPSEASVALGYREIADIASSIMLHIGGMYVKEGQTHYAASEGCEGIAENSTSASNDYVDKVMTTLYNQSEKSKIAKGRIDVIIEKRQKTDIPQNVNHKIEQ